MIALPKKLKKNAIIEAVWEIRFDTNELPEIAVGRLIDHPTWGKFERARSPLSDVPAAIRLGDPNLKYQPIVELRERSGQRLVKIGTNVLSYHRLNSYTVWDDYSPLLEDATDFLFDRFPKLSARRLGLRYINALTPDDHLIKGVAQLNMEISVRGERLTEGLNLNYRIDDTRLGTMIRIATPNLVQGAIPPNTAVYLDVDVFTPDNATFEKAGDVKTWVHLAHVRQREAFFGILPDEIIEKLRDDD